MSELTDGARAILSRAQDLVDKGWCQGVMAIAADGLPVPPLSHHATCFCAAGAVERAGHELRASDRDLAKAGRSLGRVTTPKYSITGFNDSPKRTKHEVVAAFTRAMA